MKTYALWLTMTLFLFFPSTAKIKNGYSLDIHGARESLKNIKRILKEDKDLSIFQRMAMHSKIKDLTEFIIYFELTDKLLEQFEAISPDLYAEIDTLTNRKGRSVDVFVRFVPEEEMPRGVAGTTNVAQDTADPDAYSSEYGLHTVSVRIRAEKKSLHLLAHELGHVRYQVPHLASYMSFYAQYYLENNFRAKSIGHNDNDASGRQARAYSQRFKLHYLTFLKTTKPKVQSHLALIQEIKNSVVN